MKFKLGGAPAICSHGYMFLVRSTKVSYFNHAIIFLLSSSIGAAVDISGLWQTGVELEIQFFSSMGCIYVVCSHFHIHRSFALL